MRNIIISTVLLITVVQAQASPRFDKALGVASVTTANAICVGQYSIGIKTKTARSVWELLKRETGISDTEERVAISQLVQDAKAMGLEAFCGRVRSIWLRIPLYRKILV